MDFLVMGDMYGGTCIGREAHLPHIFNRVPHKKAPMPFLYCEIHFILWKLGILHFCFEIMIMHFFVTKITITHIFARICVQRNATSLDILLYCTVLYSTVLYCTVLYITVLYCSVLYGRVGKRHRSRGQEISHISRRNWRGERLGTDEWWLATLYCTVLYCTVLYCTVLYCTILYCT